jgi:Mannosyltransferase (PIG-V)
MSTENAAFASRARAVRGPWTPAAIWSTPLRRALMVTAVWRALIFAMGIVAHAVKSHGPTASQTLMHHGWPRKAWTYLIDAGVRQDAWWYARIAQHGYTFSTHHLSSIVFYPLFPLVIKTVGFATGSVYVAGMLVSTVCLFLSVFVLQMWLDDRGMGKSSAMTVALMLCFPFGFFWVSMYSESLFLLLALSTFVAYERGKLWPAAVLAFLAVLARPTGLIIAPCLAVMALNGTWPGLSGLKATMSRGFLPWLPVVAGPLAFASFAAYQWLLFGTPLASVKAEAVPPFSRSLSHALSDLMLRRTGFPPWFLAFMLVIALTFVALVPLVYARFGLPYALFAALVVLFPLASGLTSMERYVLIDFPVFAAIAMVRWRIIPVALSVIGFYALLGFMTLFISGYTLI